MNNQTVTENKYISDTLAENQSTQNTLCDDKCTQTLPEEKLFTQSELENLISERLKRERKTQSALLPVKEMLGVLCDKGIIKNGSYPEMANQLCGYLDTLLSGTKEENISVGQTQAQEETSPECEKLQAVNSSDVQEPQSNTSSIFDNSGQLCVTTSDIAQIYEKYPSSDIGKTLCSPAFLKFSQGRQGTFPEIYSDFMSLKNLLVENSNNESNSARSALASTAFSADSRSSFSGEHSNLTARQMQMAKNAGLSYREYSDLLNSIPKGTRSSSI